jgi:prepilin-type N-terminal cleavage/methylation domain-containing protein
MMKSYKSRDDGYTVIELMVSLAVFSVLAIISATAMLTIFSGIRQVAAQSNELAQAQNTAEWVSRLVRYADMPLGTSAPIVLAGPDSIVLYSYSGTGERSDIPYKIRVMTIDQIDGTRDVISDVAPGVLIDGEWQWSGDWNALDAPEGAVRRFLLSTPIESDKPLKIDVFACQVDGDCNATMRNVTPPSTGPLLLDENEVPQYVEVTLGATSDPLNSVRQQVRLVNQL